MSIHVLRSFRRSVLHAAVLAASVHAAAIAKAEPTPGPSTDTKTEMKLHFQRGVKLYSEEDYRASLVEFKRAYEISSNVAILYNIGQTQFQLRDYASALQSFEKYLSGGGSQLSAARRQQVEKDIEDLRGRVAKVTIETNVPGAEITLDDVPLGTAPLAGPLDVSAGQRKLGASMDGYVSVVRSVELAGGDTTTVHLELVPVPAPGPRPTVRPPTSTQQPATPHGTDPLVFVGYGIAAAGLATGTVAGIVALDTKDELDSHCSGGVCPTSVRNKGDTLTLQATVSTIGFGVGIVGAAVGTYFLLAGPSASTPSTNAATSRLSPWFAGTSAGLNGTF